MRLSLRRRARCRAGAVRRAGARRGWRGEQGTPARAPAGPVVHEPVSLKACLCLASLLEAHLLISTKEKNGVGNMWMPPPPCLGSQVPRTQYSAWGRKQGERVLKVLRGAAKKTQVFSVLSRGGERGEKYPWSCSAFVFAPFQALQGVPYLSPRGGESDTRALSSPLGSPVAPTPASGTRQDVF